MAEITGLIDPFAPVEGYDPQTERLLNIWDTVLVDRPTNAEYPTDPIEFMHDYLGIRPWAKQEEIVYAVWENRYTSVASCHAIGKSFITAAILITFLHTHENSIVLSTAPTGRQVEHVLWRNVRSLWRQAKRPLLGRRPLTTRYDIADNWYAMGFKPNDQETDPLQGFHAENLLAIIDEAAGSPPSIIDGMMAAMTSGGSKMMMIGNPTSTSGPFFDSHHSKKDQFKTFTVAWPDTPNYTEGYDKFGYLITQKWVDDVISRYGEESPYVQSRVYARWVSSDDVLISGSDIETAQNREITEEQFAILEPIEAGLDVARDGGDRTILCIRRGAWVEGMYQITSGDGMETAGKALRKIRDIVGDVPVHLKIDEIGVGTSVLDFANLATRDFSEYRTIRVTGVNFSKKPWDMEQYYNQRSEAYNLLAGRFKSGQIGGNIANEAASELSDIKTKYNGKHTQPVVEPKDEIKKRLGRSPDYADAIVLAFYNPPPDEIKPIGVLAFGYAKNNVHTSGVPLQIKKR